jgi:hypothetical protein
MFMDSYYCSIMQRRYFKYIRYTASKERRLRVTGDSRYTRFSYPRFHISAVLFQFYEKHAYPIHGQILKPITCVEPYPGLSENVMQMISLASKNSGVSLT